MTDAQPSSGAAQGHPPASPRARRRGELTGWQAVLVLLAIGVIGAGGYWLYQRQRPARQARALYREALAARRAHNPEQAAQLLAGAIIRRPAMFEAHLALGDVRVELGRLLEAVDSYRQATRLRPKHTDAFVRLGAALAACERFDEAEVALQHAAALAPRNPRPLVTLGHVRMLRQRWPEAAEAFAAALTLAPNDAELHYDLGRAYQHAGKAEQAAEAYRQALKCDPKHQPAERALAELTGAATQAGAEQQ